MEISEKVKELIENNMIFLGTSSQDNRPNVTIVDRAKVTDSSEILIRDVEMVSCRENLLANPNCCLVIYGEADDSTYKIFGSVKDYINNGEEFESAREDVNSRGRNLNGIFRIGIDKFYKLS